MVDAGDHAAGDAGVGAIVSEFVVTQKHLDLRETNIGDVLEYVKPATQGQSAGTKIREPDSTAVIREFQIGHDFPPDNLYKPI